MAVLVELNGIHLRFGSHIVFEDMSFAVRREETVGVLGLIGAGKSQLLRLIAGLKGPDRGDLRFENGLSSADVGFVFQEDRLIPWLTVRENLRICLRVGDGVDGLSIIDDFGVRPLLDKKPAELSGGMRQKINLVRALMNESRLILMDEPTRALDPIEKQEFFHAIEDLKKKRSFSLVFVTHDPEEAFGFCDRVALISKREKRVAKVLEVSRAMNADEAHIQAQVKALRESVFSFYRTDQTKREHEK